MKILIIISLLISSVFPNDTLVESKDYFKMSYRHMSRMLFVTDRYPAKNIRSIMKEYLHFHVPRCAKIEIEENDSLYHVEYNIMNNCNSAEFIIDKKTLKLITAKNTEYQCPTSKIKDICQEHKMISYNRKTLLVVN